MGLWEQAQKDLAAFTSNTDSGPAKTATFTAPNGSTDTVALVPTKHHLGVNEEGKNVNAKKASVCVSEQLLNVWAYPVRNASNEVSMTGHRVRWMDSNSLCQYIIREEYPDEALGLIVFILGDFE